MRLIVLILFIPSLCFSQRLNEIIHNEITIEEIHSLYESGSITIPELTKFYLNRIDSLNHRGPELNAIITINPEALLIAEKLENERILGKIRGPLHGIPIILKDNIDTGDKMPCTAGALPMRNSFPIKDSPIATQLRNAGAIILGKANLSEWANFHSYTSSSGWSGLGGQTKNPYNINLNPCGSSSGSAVGVSANFSIIAIGTETNGSIVCPSNNNGVVGIKPTVGLISRTGIIPISGTFDTPGPIARTLTDAVVTLGCLTKIDSSDSRTLELNRVSTDDYTKYLNADGLSGKRIGYYSKPLESDERLRPIMDSAIMYMKDRGATIINLDEIVQERIHNFAIIVMLYEFKTGLNHYLLSLGNNRPVENLEDLIQQTFVDSLEMENNDHQLLKLAQTKEDLSSKEYILALETVLELSRNKGIDSVMSRYNLDAIVAPTGSPAWLIDQKNGDSFGASSSSASAYAGYPNINIPMGEVEGLPVGLSIFGGAWSEGILIEIAYDYEQGTMHRKTPKFMTK